MRRRRYDERILCRRCAERYREARIELIPNWAQKEKEPCMICDALGRAYFILGSKGDKDIGKKK